MLRPPSYCENAEGLFASPSDSVHITIEEAAASTRVPEFLLRVGCVGDGRPLAGMASSPSTSTSSDACNVSSGFMGWSSILRTYGWFSCLGKSTGITSTLRSYGVKLTTSDPFLPAVVAGEIHAVEDVDTLLSSRKLIHSPVRLWMHATMSWLGIQNDSITFTAHLRC